MTFRKGSIAWNKGKKGLQVAWNKGVFRNTDKEFWDRVSIKSENDCWEWLGSFNSGGYGQFVFRGVNRLSNRLAYEFTYGSISSILYANMDFHIVELHVCHTCDNPSCCNPNHLWLGTVKDNMDDRNRKSRVSSGENHPISKLSVGNVIEILKLYSTGKYNQTELGKQFKVSADAVGNIVHNRSWNKIQR